MAEETALRFLVVDDDAVDVMNIQRAFEKNRTPQSHLFIATDGKDAIQKLKSQEIPLQSLVVLLDLNMPRMNGIDFLRELRKDADISFLPVIVLTTSSEEKDVIEAYHLNVAGYLRKPVDFNDLAELMGTLYKYWSFGQFPEV